ncbi:DUF1513 domain-containing protein [Solimonas sp. SE-A11]|uniref:DUF1513 domain-containing protein n=1 Tax=Solimonas sp. SE-A11 TaxID=3054954 RepID=UPI00345F9B13
MWSPELGARGIALPGRAHELIEDEWRRGEAIAVARRPGEFIVRFNLEARRAVHLVEAEQMRRFNGHAVFSPDGKILYTSENDLVSGKGVIGVRDGVTLEKRAELPSYGIGPHGLILEPDGVLLIANGGIVAIPKPGEGQAELERMAPTLTRLRISDGALLDQWILPDRFLSIRHLARGMDGSIGVALQAAHANQASREEAPVFALLRNGAFETIDSPPEMRLQGYAGDVAQAQVGNAVHYALGCSHSGLVARWNSTGQWLGAAPLPRACALASYGESFLAVTEEGEMLRLPTSGAGPTSLPTSDAKWENHISLIHSLSASI